MKNHTETKYIDPCRLIIHIELLRIYGRCEKKVDLHTDIEKNGIIVPIVVSTRTSENVVVSGSRRLQAALSLSIDRVPVVFYRFPNEEAEKHFILSANQERPKTKYQRILEGREWEKFEKEAAAKRRKKGLDQRWNNDGDFDIHDYYPATLLSDYRSASPDALQPKKKKLRSTDRVGARIGMSASSYERAKPIVEKCEKLRERRKSSEAVVLEEYLESCGIKAALRLVKSFDCDVVLKMVATGEAKTVSIALTNISRISNWSAIKPGAIFFFPNNKLRKATYFHLGRVVDIANQIATVCFRDSIDNDLYEHQYKCDELLCLSLVEEDWEQQSLRNRMHYLLSHSNASPTDRYLLNRLLKPVISIHSEIEYLQIIDWRVAGVRKFAEVVA